VVLTLKMMASNQSLMSSGVLGLYINKRTGRYATCPLDLCHIIGLRPPFLALRASTRPAALISANGLNFRPFRALSLPTASIRSAVA